MIVTPYFNFRKGTHTVSRIILFLEIRALRTNQLFEDYFCQTQMDAEAEGRNEKHY